MNLAAWLESLFQAYVKLIGSARYGKMDKAAQRVLSVETLGQKWFRELRKVDVDRQLGKLVIQRMALGV